MGRGVAAVRGDVRALLDRRDHVLLDELLQGAELVGLREARQLGTEIAHDLHRLGVADVALAAEVDMLVRRSERLEFAGRLFRGDERGDRSERTHHGSHFRVLRRHRISILLWLYKVLPNGGHGNVPRGAWACQCTRTFYTNKRTIEKAM